MTQISRSKILTTSILFSISDCVANLLSESHVKSCDMFSTLHGLHIDG